MGATDAFRPKDPAPLSPRSDRSESPVLVHRTDSLPPPVEDLHNPRQVDPERRVLPWSSTVVSDRPATANDNHQVPISPTHSTLQPRSQSEMRHRDASLDSGRPLLQDSSVQSSPRHRNVLLKKNSIRQRTSSSDSQRRSLQPRSRQVSDTGRSGPSLPRGGVETDSERESWTMVDPPSNVGRLGMTMYSNVDTEQQALAVRDHQTIPAPQITSVGAQS